MTTEMEEFEIPVLPGRSEHYDHVAPSKPRPPREEPAGTRSAVLMQGLRVMGDHGIEYDVKLFEDGSVYCSCPSWKFQHTPPAYRTCKHTRRVVEGLFEEKNGQAV